MNLIDIKISEVSEVRQKYAHKSGYIITMIYEKPYFRLNDVVELVDQRGAILGVQFKINFINNGWGKHTATLKTLTKHKRNLTEHIKSAVLAYTAYSVAGNQSSHG